MPLRARSLVGVVLAVILWRGGAALLETAGRLRDAPPRGETFRGSEEEAIRRALGEDFRAYEALREEVPEDGIVLVAGLDPVRPDPLPRFWWIRVLLYPKRVYLDREYFSARRRGAADPWWLDARHFVLEPLPGTLPSLGGRLRLVRREERFALWRFVGSP